jgi:hypothetical protein
MILFFFLPFQIGVIDRLESRQWKPPRPLRTAILICDMTRVARETGRKIDWRFTNLWRVEIVFYPAAVVKPYSRLLSYMM